MKNNPVVTIEMENGGVMKVELYPETAPNTVANFISLVEKGFYNGTIFHRVIPGFMIQGGDPEGTGMGGPGYRIKGEFTANRFQNDLKHTKGVISMARSGHPDSAGSQFFIMVDDAPHLDGQYASFGKVIEGIEVADQIVSVATNYSDRPLEEQRMRSVTVETFGETDPRPKKAEKESWEYSVSQPLRVRPRRRRGPSSKRNRRREFQYTIGSAIRKEQCGLPLLRKRKRG